MVCTPTFRTVLNAPKTPNWEERMDKEEQIGLTRLVSSLPRRFTASLNWLHFLDKDTQTIITHFLYTTESARCSLYFRQSRHYVRLRGKEEYSIQFAWNCDDYELS